MKCATAFLGRAYTAQVGGATNAMSCDGRGNRGQLVFVHRTDDDGAGALSKCRGRELAVGGRAFIPHPGMRCVRAC